MALTEEEFETNKSIAVPPKPIPLMEEEDIVFLQVWYGVSIRLFVVIGVLSNIVKSNGVDVPKDFYNGMALALFLFFPIAILTLIRILRSGKSKGFIEQKLAFYFKSSLLNELDNSTTEGRQELIDVNNGIYNIIKSKEFWKNNKIEQTYDIKENYEELDEDYQDSLKNLEKSYYIKGSIDKKNQLEVEEKINNYYKFLEEN